jgi:hypothetical protein
MVVAAAAAAAAAAELQLQVLLLLLLLLLQQVIQQLLIRGCCREVAAAAAAAAAPLGWWELNAHPSKGVNAFMLTVFLSWLGLSGNICEVSNLPRPSGASLQNFRPGAPCMKESITTLLTSTLVLLAHKTAGACNRPTNSARHLQDFLRACPESAAKTSACTPIVTMAQSQSQSQSQSQPCNCRQAAAPNPNANANPWLSRNCNCGQAAAKTLKRERPAVHIVGDAWEHM